MHSGRDSQVYHMLKFHYIKYIFQIVRKYVTFPIVLIPDVLLQISHARCFSYERTTNSWGVTEDT
jgi:hypothetical protein